MLITFGSLLIVLLMTVRPLQKNAFFLMYFGLMMVAAYVCEQLGYRFTPFSKQSFWSFLGWHFVLINFVTILAYGADKRAAIKQQWRIPEYQLHLLEFLGGSPGAFVAQRLFRHKTKKASFQIFFLFVLAIQILIVYYALRILNII